MIEPRKFLNFDWHREAPITWNQSGQCKLTTIFKKWPKRLHKDCLKIFTKIFENPRKILKLTGWCNCKSSAFTAVTLLTPEFAQQTVWEPSGLTDHFYFYPPSSPLPLSPTPPPQWDVSPLQGPSRQPPLLPPAELLRSKGGLRGALLIHLNYSK